MFTTDNSSNIVIPEPKVINKEAIVIKQYGQIVGVISAEYDFSKVPPKYHETALGFVRRTVVIHDCIPEDYPIKRVVGKKRTSASWISRLLEVFRD